MVFYLFIYLNGLSLTFVGYSVSPGHILSRKQAKIEQNSGQ